MYIGVNTLDKTYELHGYVSYQSNVFANVDHVLLILTGMKMNKSTFYY